MAKTVRAFQRKKIEAEILQRIYENIGKELRALQTRVENLEIKVAEISRQSAGTEQGITKALPGKSE